MPSNAVELLFDVRHSKLIRPDVSRLDRMTGNVVDVLLPICEMRRSSATSRILERRTSEPSTYLQGTTWKTLSNASVFLSAVEVQRASVLSEIGSYISRGSAANDDARRRD